MDYYLERGCPDILFIDEFKGNMRFNQLLSMLDKYSRNQTHAHYNNIYNLWTRTIITSVYPPEQVYTFMVDEERRGVDSIKQLLRRLDVIVYHYKQADEYKSYSIPVSEYIDYEDLKQRAFENEKGFTSLVEENINPFMMGMGKG